MNKRNALLPVVLLSGLLLVGCDTESERADNTSEPTSQAEEANTDPRVGSVPVNALDGYRPRISKFCDGTTLVYERSNGYQGGLSVIADSPECAPQ